MVKITKTFYADAAHRLMNHPGKCRNLHGHRYQFDITFEGEPVDGMLLDFGDLKERIGGWIDHHYDHGLLLQRGDPLLQAVVDCDPDLKLSVFESPPTAEVMSMELLRVVRRIVRADWGDRSVRVVRVVCYETPTGCASCEDIHE